MLYINQTLASYYLVIFFISDLCTFYKTKKIMSNIILYVYEDFSSKRNYVFFLPYKMEKIDMN